MTDAFEDLAALPTEAADPKIQRRITRSNQAYRREIIRAREKDMDRATTQPADGHSHAASKSLPQLSDMVRYELKQAQALLEATSLAPEPRDHVAQSLARIMKEAFKDHAFLGGASGMVLRDSRRKIHWDLACWPKVATQLPDPQEYARVSERMTAVQHVIAEEQARISAVCDQHLAQAKNRVMLGTIRKHLDHVATLVSYGDGLVTENYRNDTRSR